MRHSNYILNVMKEMANEKLHKNQHESEKTGKPLQKQTAPVTQNSDNKLGYGTSEVNMKFRHEMNVQKAMTIQEVEQEGPKLVDDEGDLETQNCRKSALHGMD